MKSNVKKAKCWIELSKVVLNTQCMSLLVDGKAELFSEVLDAPKAVRLANKLSSYLGIEVRA